MVIEHINSQDMIVDILTKTLPPKALNSNPYILSSLVGTS